jgi:hypothetical protein
MEKRPWKADRRGFCDECADEPVLVMEDVDEPGEYQYCEGCWATLEAARERKERQNT